MSVSQEERTDVCASERRLLEVLHELGPQTVDELRAIPDPGWARALLAGDHLSRSHEIMLELIAPRECRVSLAGARV